MRRKIGAPRLLRRVAGRSVAPMWAGGAKQIFAEALSKSVGGFMFGNILACASGVRC